MFARKPIEERIAETPEAWGRLDVVAAEIAAENGPLESTDSVQEAMDEELRSIEWAIFSHTGRFLELYEEIASLREAIAALSAGERPGPVTFDLAAALEAATEDLREDL